MAGLEWRGREVDGASEGKGGPRPIHQEEIHKMLTRKWKLATKDPCGAARECSWLGLSTVVFSWTPWFWVGGGHEADGLESGTPACCLLGCRKDQWDLEQAWEPCSGHLQGVGIAL